MVRATVPREQREAIGHLIPAEVARARELREQGVLEASYRAADQSYSWLVLQGESEDFLQRTLESLPLYPYFQLDRTPLLDLGQASRPATEAVKATVRP
jgi:muconolactone delta-isomerase